MLGSVALNLAHVQLEFLIGPPQQPAQPFRCHATQQLRGAQDTYLKTGLAIGRRAGRERSPAVGAPIELIAS